MNTRTIKPIADCPFYFVGDDGTVWTSRRKGGNERAAGQIGELRQMKVSVQRNGYLSVSFDVDGRVVTKQIHVLVLEAFVGPRPDGCQACHYPDATPSNNALSNLRWDTVSENARDKYRHLEGREQKECTGCKKSLLLSEFYFDKRATDQRTSACKSCTMKASIETRDEDKKRQRNREYMRRKRAANPSAWRHQQQS